jgi:hypothetical protein
MDSGNKGYASKTEKVRPGPFIVAHITSNSVFRCLKWRETSVVPLQQGFTREGRVITRRPNGAGLCLITRVRQRGRPWILRLRFELYVNLGWKAVPEE